MIRDVGVQKGTEDPPALQFRRVAWNCIIFIAFQFGPLELMQRSDEVG